MLIPYTPRCQRTLNTVILCTGFQARSGGGGWNWIDPQVTPEEVMSREVEPAGLRKLDFFGFELFLNSCAADTVLVTAQPHGS